jgi:acyl-coenzyme A thioesterase PaaI-like protein
VPETRTRDVVRLRPLPGFPVADEVTKNRRLLDAIVAGNAPAPPYVGRLALPRPTGWKPGEVECRTRVGEEVGWDGVIFGGYLAAVADLFGGLAMLTVLPDGARFLTAELGVTFTTPIVPGNVRITARVTELSTRGATVQVLLRQRNRVAGRARTDQVIQPAPEKSTSDSSAVRREER